MGAGWGLPRDAALRGRRVRRTPRVESPRAAAEPGREQEPLGRGAGMGAGRREDGE